MGFLLLGLLGLEIERGYIMYMYIYSHDFFYSYNIYISIYGIGWF